MTQQEIVARAIHAADETHKSEPWDDVKGSYRAMAAAAIKAMPAPAYPLSRPAKDYMYEIACDAVHNAVLRNPGMSMDDVADGLREALESAQEVYDNAQEDEA